MSRLCVIIPCYNELLRIPGIVEMFFRQTRQPDELIIVDDCSTDGSYELLRSLMPACPFLNVIRTPKNIGPVGAMQSGFRGVTTAAHYTQNPISHVFFGAMDDGWAPLFVERMMQAAFLYPQAGIVFCDVLEGRDILGHRFVPGYSDPHQAASQMQGQNIYGCAAVWRHDVIEASHMFDPALRWHSDWFASQATALAHGVVYVPEVLAESTFRPDSYSNRGRLDWEQQGPILEHILGLMNAPEFYHLLPAFIWAKSMNHFPEVVRLLLEKPYLMTGTNRLLLRDALAQG